jgi:hypothetical protein
VAAFPPNRYEAISSLQEVRSSLWPISFPVYASTKSFAR